MYMIQVHKQNKNIHNHNILKHYILNGHMLIQNIVRVCYSPSLCSPIVEQSESVMVRVRYGPRSHGFYGSTKVKIWDKSQCKRLMFFISSPVSFSHHFAFYIFINSSETAGPILTKLWWKVSMIVLFKICVRFCRAPSNMAAMARHNLTLDPMGIFHFCQLL